jgi:putative endonuclease
VTGVVYKMFYAYLIKSKNKKWIYIGSTKDLRQRFKEHNIGKVNSTKPHKPFILIYYEAYPTYSLARKREIELKKKGQQKEILFKRLGLM